MLSAEHILQRRAHRRHEVLDRIAVAAPALALGGALVLAAVGLTEPRLELSAFDGSRLWIGVGVDRLAAVLLVLISAIGLVVQVYAGRALRHEPGRHHFLGWSTALLGASLLVAVAASPVVLAAGWCAGGLALVRLVGARGPAGRSLARSIGLGDLALVAALGLVVTTAGAVDLQEPGGLTELAAGGWAWTLAAFLLVGSVASRSAQVPFSDWLPTTVGAPTAVSVLLHAGVVNAGAVLLLRLGGVLDAAPLAWLALAAVAGWTMVASVSAIAVTTDTKGGLVRSTAAQTGFLLLTVAAALPVAAVAHLVGHAAYKAGAFLGVGGVVSAHHRARTIDAPESTTARRVGLTTLGVASTAALLLGSVAVLPGYDPDPLLLAFTLATASAALIGWLVHRPDPAGVATGLIAATVIVPAYVGLLAALEAYLAPALAPSPFDGIGWVALVVAAVAATAPHLARAVARRLPTPTLEDAVFRFSMATARPPRAVPATVPAATGRRGAR